MEIKPHQAHGQSIAKVISDAIVISNAGDGLDLLGNIYYQGFDRLILHEENITPSFFDLKTGMAGELLQKFSNYRMKLTIVGNFEKYQSNSLNAFISESNRHGILRFVGSLDEALLKES